MYEPSCEGHAGAAEPEVGGENVGEADLETLLQQVDEDHDGDGGVELVQEGEAEVEHEDDRGRQEAQQLPGQHPASQRQREWLKLQQETVTKIILYIYLLYIFYNNNNILLFKYLPTNSSEMYICIKLKSITNRTGRATNTPFAALAFGVFKMLHFGQGHSFIKLILTCGPQSRPATRL